MVEAALVFGIVIFLGLAFTLAKLPLRWSLWLLGHHVMLDIAITALAFAMHWGTMTGMMAATFAGLICGLTTTTARWAVGYRKGGLYTPGHWDLTARILREKQLRSAAQS